ncbi:hypothetical protein PVAP13_8KG291300 [Panicum virgatum]|uniref:Uncharacterized protein n=1 Tax=Panicum virgatum TaxID=38727 RepID=A0A8T0PRN6_PANVG|nr:hypothetical protein PVAP13_8KG291300 [Panicum virgatum]
MTDTFVLFITFSIRSFGRGQCYVLGREKERQNCKLRNMSRPAAAVWDSVVLEGHNRTTPCWTHEHKHGHPINGLMLHAQRLSNMRQAFKCVFANIWSD